MTKFKRNNISDKVDKAIRVRSNLPAKTIKKAKVKAKGGNGNGNGKDIRTLTKRQARFVDEYPIDLNGTKAAIRAGYAVSGAAVIACNLLRNNNVQERIAERMLVLREKTQWTQEEVLNTYHKLIDYSLEDIYDEDHKLLPVSQMSKNARFAVCGMKSVKSKSKRVSKNGAVSESETIMSDLKFTPKKDILDKVGEHLGMFASPDDTPRGGISIDKAVINIKFVD